MLEAFVEMEDKASKSPHPSESPLEVLFNDSLESLRENLLGKLALTGNPLNRLSYERKDASFLSSLISNPSSICLPFLGFFPLVQKSPSGGKQPKWMRLSEVEALLGSSSFKEDLILLGTINDVAHYAVTVPDGAPFGSEDSQFGDLRRNIFFLSHADAAIVGQARALVEWHSGHLYCGACGSRTVPIEGGTKRICTKVEEKEKKSEENAPTTSGGKKGCGMKSYPQTTPAVIMLVLSPDGKKCLLGRQKIWPPGMWSSLAGFVDTAETPEEAVRREVMEEAGLEVGKVRYFGCQPWPFGGQLMLGFFAVAKSDAIKVDQNELEAAEWYPPEKVKEGLEVSNSSPASFYSLTEWRLPPVTAIANRLATAWVECHAKL